MLGARAKLRAYLALLAVALCAAAPALRFSKHARARMEQRGVSEAAVRRIVETVEPFEYRHDGAVKLGYYDEPRAVFVATAQGVVVTVITNVTPRYVERLKGRAPPKRLLQLR